jgi:hypothetical protein
MCKILGFYVSDPIFRFEKHMDVLFMITHDANFNTAVQALILIYQVANAKQACPTLS